MMHSSRIVQSQSVELVSVQDKHAWSVFNVILNAHTPITFESFFTLDPKVPIARHSKAETKVLS